MTFADIAPALTMALQHFDSAIGPQGLYAAEEHGVEVPRLRCRHEWDACLMPALQSLDCKCPGGGSPSYNWKFHEHGHALAASFRLPDRRTVHLDMLRISKIKVRRYGSGYQVDRRVDFSARWQKISIPSYLKRWSPLRNSLRMLVLVGFDRHRIPLGRELAGVGEDRNATHFGWELHTRCWPDPHQRGFNTCAAVWYPSEAASAPQDVNRLL